MHLGRLRDFSHFGKRDDTLEDLAYQYGVLQDYRRGFIQPSLRSYGFDGRRLAVVSGELRDLLARNIETDRTLVKYVGDNNEYVMLSGQMYSVCTDNIAYEELLKEHKQLEAAADKLFSVDMSLQGSIEKIQNQAAYTLHNEQLLNFRRNCCIGVTVLGIASAVLAKMFGW